MVEDIPGCSIDLDSISLLGFLSLFEFQTAATYQFNSKETSAKGHVTEYEAVIDFNNQIISRGNG
jgi:hypothetical protein